MPLLEFVLTGRNHLAWSYATCFANPFFPGFEKEFDIFEFRTHRETALICLILHASGIWAMAPRPNGLGYKKIEILSNHVFGILTRSNIKKYLGIKVNTNRICIGSASFYWIKPSIPVQISSPLENNMIFTNCKICGQIIKTGSKLKSPLETQMREKHRYDKYYRCYLFRSQTAPNIDTLELICDNCLSMHVYNKKEFFVFEFNREKGTFTI